MRQFLLLLCILSVLSCTEKPGGGPEKNTLNTVNKATDSLSVDDFEGVWINYAFYRNIQLYRTNTPHTFLKYLNRDIADYLYFSLKRNSDSAFYRNGENSYGKDFENEFSLNTNNGILTLQGVYQSTERLILADKGMLIRKDKENDISNQYDLYINLNQFDIMNLASAKKYINSKLISGVYKDKDGKKYTFTDDGNFKTDDKNEYYSIGYDFDEYMGDNIHFYMFPKSYNLMYEWQNNKLLLYGLSVELGGMEGVCWYYKQKEPLYELTYISPAIDSGKGKKIENLSGTWLNTHYMEALTATKSPYLASQVDAGSSGIYMFYIGKKNDSVYHRMLSGSFHDGARDDFKGLKFIADPEIYQFIYTNPNFSGDSTELEDKISFKEYNEVIWAYGKSPDYDAYGSYTQIGYTNEDYMEVLENFARQVVMEGSYRDRAGNYYSFNKYGNFTGPGFSKKYTVGLDHVEIGFDYITINPHQEGFKRLEFKWKGNKLYLYEVQTKKDEWPQKNYNKKPLYVLEKNEKFF